MALAQVNSVPDSTAAKRTIIALVNAIHPFFWDLKRYPNSAEELIKSEYVSIEPAILREWTFTFEGTPPRAIYATPRASVGKKVREHESPPGQIMLDMYNGIWWGYGNPTYYLPLNEEEQADYLRNLKSVVLRIWERAQFYHLETGTWPESVEELIAKRYVWIDWGFSGQWQFAFVGSPPQAIVGISKQPMPGGPGKSFEYDIAYDRWRGYGFGE